MFKELEETRAQACLIMVAIKKHRKTYYDSKLKPRELKENGLLLL
jgi:hypothetical protein